jgi:hypothetical protein
MTRSYLFLFKLYIISPCSIGKMLHQLVQFNRMQSSLGPLVVLLRMVISRLLAE